MRLSMELSRNALLIFVVCLLGICSGYTLEGQWELMNQQSKVGLSVSAIKARFINNLVTAGLISSQDVLDGDSTNQFYKGTKQLIVYACQTLTYNYYINQNSMYLHKVKNNVPVRPCQPNQIQQIQRRLNLTFYFTIQNNSLLLLDNCHVALFQFQRNDLSVFQAKDSQLEVWELQTLLGKKYEAQTQKKVLVGNQSFIICDQKGKFDYEVTQRNNLKTKQDFNNCQNKDIASAIRDSRFYLIKGRIMTLYDQQLNELSTLSFTNTVLNQTEVTLYRTTGTSGTNTTQNTSSSTGNTSNSSTGSSGTTGQNSSSQGNKNSTVVVVIVENTTATNSNSNTKSSSNAGTSSVQINGSNLTSNIQTSANTNNQNAPSSSSGTSSNGNSTNSNQSLNSTQRPSQTNGTTTSTSPNTATNTNTSTNTATTTTTPPTSTNSQNAGTSGSNSQTSGQFFSYNTEASQSCLCNPLSGKDALSLFPEQVLYNKWYLYAINGTDYVIDDYYYYSMIISPGRMIYYGGCQVRWTPFRLAQNALFDLNTRTFNKTSCINPNLDSSVLAPFFKEVKYVNYEKNQDIPYIVFYNQNYGHVATFHTRVPKYPPLQDPQ